MSVAKITETYLDDIADAIRFKRMSEDTYTPPEMADAIMAIQGGPNAVAVVNSVDPDTGGTIKTIVGTDISGDTVTANSLLKGYTAHTSDGTLVEGTFEGGPAGLVYQDENGYIVLSDEGNDSSNGAIVVKDTIDPVSGGTIRNITAVDISNDTVTAATLLSGYTAHDAQGNAITGTATGWTTDGIATNAEPNGAITISSATTTGQYALYNKTAITSVYSSSLTTIDNTTFKGCTGLVSVDMPNLTTINASGFYGCNHLTTINLPNLQSIGTEGFRNCTALTGFNQPSLYTLNQYSFAGCTSLQYFVMRGDNGTSTHGNGISAGYCFYGCSNLIGADIKYKYSSSTNIAQHSFENCTNFSILVLRPNTVCSLSSTSPFANTPFKNGGTGGTIYIPEVLYDHLGDGTEFDYKNASNWSVYDGYGTITWAKIEGSYYETHYVDGTSISS